MMIGPDSSSLAKIYYHCPMALLCRHSEATMASKNLRVTIALWPCGANGNKIMPSFFVFMTTLLYGPLVLRGHYGLHNIMTIDLWPCGASDNKNMPFFR